MKLSQIYKSDDIVISYEIFPPKALNSNLNEKINTLINELKILAKFNPAFISVTYGAGGSNQDTSLQIVLKIKKELNILPMPHFTCVGATREKIQEYLHIIEKEGIENILALRGDPPKGELTFTKPANGFGHANELVQFIKNSTNLSIAVAGYPEKHPECASIEQDIQNLKRKIDNGAEIVITQLFYDNNIFYDFVEKATKAGINVPIIPGILPMTSFKQIEKISSLGSCYIPKELIDNLNKNQNNNDEMFKIGTDFAIKQCQELIDNKIKGLHFYTLNKAHATKHILENTKLT